MRPKTIGNRPRILPGFLERKPGAIRNGLAFKGQPWGQAFERMRLELESRYEGEGVRKYVKVLLLFAEFSEAEVRRAVKTASGRRSSATSGSPVRCSTA